jgi:dihydroorotate dehydrogenase
MPDWSYQTVFRPVLTRLPFEVARGLVFGFFRRLTSVPGGGTVINLLGHMAPDERLRCEVAGLELSSPVGLAAGIDVRGDALGAMARFGSGLIEVGPVSLFGRQSSGEASLDRRRETLINRGRFETVALATIANRLATHQKRQPVVLRVLVDAVDADTLRSSIRNILDATRDRVDAYSLQLPSDFPADPQQLLAATVTAFRDAGCEVPLFLCVTNKLVVETGREMPARVSQAGVTGLLLDGSLTTNDGVQERGAACFEQTLAATLALRAADPALDMLVSGGVHEPWQAVELLDAGANVVLIDSGLVFGGPGLAKRINETLLATRECSPATIAAEQCVDCEPFTRQTWFWAALVAVAMLIGGGLALTIATTRVVLPYDEAFVGMSRDELCGVNDRLLPFLTHDRVTLAGTMLADGILYFGLAIWGIRCGWHWARVTFLVSSIVGFFSFFLFLGFGYFDPFHAFVTAIVFQFVLLAAHSPSMSSPRHLSPDWSNDRAWRAAQWGQLLYVVHGAAVIVAGLVISSFGVSSVFVQTDLDFMQTTVETLAGANPRLIPLIAHDRASFGGMLISCGVATLLTSLWGFRRGAAWVWWSLTLAGSVAYIATIIVHLVVGYTSFTHLVPAYGGLTAIILSGVLAAPYLLRPATLATSTPATR